MLSGVLEVIESVSSAIMSIRFQLSPYSEQEQDKSSDIEQQPPFGDRKISNIQPPNRGGGYKTNRNII